MLLAAYRSILVLNLLISTVFTFGEARSRYFGLQPWGYYLHLGLLLLFICLLLYNAKRSRLLTSRFLFAIVYTFVCFISLEIILHQQSFIALQGQASNQIYWFIAEVLLCAMLLKNDFRLQISLERSPIPNDSSLKKKK